MYKFICNGCGKPKGVKTHGIFCRYCTRMLYANLESLSATEVHEKLDLDAIYAKYAKTLEHNEKLIREEKRRKFGRITHG